MFLQRKDRAVSRRTSTVMLIVFLPLLWSATVFAQEVRPAKVLKPPREKVFEQIRDMDITRDGNRLVTVHRNGELRLWTLKTGKYITFQKLDSIYFHRVFIDPKSEWIGCYKRRDNVVHIYNIKSKKVICRELTGERVRTACFDPNGKYLATGTETTIELWSVPNFKRVAVLGKKEYASHLHFSPDGKFLASGNSGRREFVKLWDIKSKQPVTGISMRNETRGIGWCVGLEFLPDGKQLVIAWSGLPGVVLLKDLKNVVTIRRFIKPSGTDFEIALSPNGKMLAVSDDNRQTPIIVFDVATGKTLLKLPPMQGSLGGDPVVFTPDNRQLITAAGLRIYIWDLPVAKKRTVLAGLHYAQTNTARLY